MGHTQGYWISDKYLNIVSMEIYLGVRMRYSVVGLILLVIGIGMFIVSFIPIPIVSYNPRTKPVEVPTYTTVSSVWLDETFTVPAGRAMAYCGSFSSGTTLTIYINVVSGGDRDINFWVMDEGEWERFRRGESYYYYTAPSRRRITTTSFTWTPPADQRICFVYDNTFSLITSKNVYTKIIAEYPTYTVVTSYTTTYEPEVVLHSLGFLAIPGIILIIIGIGLIIGGKASKPKITP